MIITDQIMPVATGAELIQRLRKSGARVPIVMMRGHLGSKLVVELQSLGVNHFLVKPCSQKELPTAVGRALRGTTNHPVYPRT